MVASPPSANATLKRSKIETLKEQSQHLREPVATELLEPTNRFSEEGVQILKFHGSYQQDNRDNRVKGQEKDYQFMLRTRSPAGYIPPQLYLTLDRLADEYGNRTLRATTRQGFQLHGILKKNLKAAIAAIVRSMGSTLGACGDVNRNVMAPPAPFRDRPEYILAYEYAHRIADLLTPQTGAYYEIWLDGEKVISAEEHPDVKAARQRNGHGTIFPNNEEPIYGDHYMPRKFKCCVTVPGDNSVDLFSQDLTLVVITDSQGHLEGFNIYAGGGLGRTHNKEETFARMADEIGFVPAADVYEAVKAIVATQRDYGDRYNRRHARLKYLIHDWGVEKFKAKVEEYFGKPLEPFRPLPPWRYQDFLGWHPQGDGKFFYGLSIANGRILDQGNFRLKSALKKIVEDFHLPLRVTPHQNLLLCDVSPDQQAAIQHLLEEHGVQDVRAIDPLQRYSMACPALPTCGLAITESERAIPGVLERIRRLMDRLGLKDEHFVIRMTGCPNGCARPYLAELGFVGIVPGAYQTWLGGSPDQTRLAAVYIERLPIAELETALEPLLVFYRDRRQRGESFGDFCHRVGFAALRQFAANYVPTATTKRYRVDVRADQYQQLKELAAAQGRSLAAVTREAIQHYLEQSRQNKQG
ncbi:ferredoxin--sulfite reductase beta subunit Sir [Thermosynechococcus sp. NK55a]|jgi:sulfite reductase (ferredoxin)|uniref:sulfite reductase, ferredoxin dependent n=1 Tax=unclassified Thermosynechococcus TaxID=2622553 RepID=UPI0003D84275|nr:MULTISPECIES: sulfite reductase, ferredoxin dependent [unclassified Thermosynechococcus]AHB87463.1 ferredoxin--sulfite reductase beta subunit Sir [Thermosynechococcus sp. NK55a]HIK22109.1 sulfite reductase, ferredoxin dependent [Thermosynechococcus sp. M3746_W2019_013]